MLKFSGAPMSLASRASRILCRWYRSVLTQPAARYGRNTHVEPLEPRVLLSGDAGVVPEIGDYVWLDTNGNGVQDVDESGVENVTVNLRDRFGDQLLDTTVTDQDGRYGFIGLDSDEYVIEVVLPDGFVFTDSYQGSDEQLDSDVQSYNGQSYSFFYSSGENDIDIDAGLQKLVDIQIFVF